MKARRCDCVIAGYGPVGATLANLLARQGLHSIVIEQRAAIDDKAREIGMDHEAMRVMQACGIADAVARKALPSEGSHWIAADGGPIDGFGPYPPAYPLCWIPTFTVIQPQLEVLLRERAARRPQIEVRFGHKLVDFAQDERGVAVTAVDVSSSEIISVKADWLLACDGASRPVRAKLGIALKGQAFDERWVVVDAFLSHDTLPPKSTALCGPSRPTNFILGPQGLLRCEIKVLPGEQPEAFKNKATIREALRPYVDADALDICRSSVYCFRALIADRWRHERVMLVGDAAHQTPPFLGQGLRMGIRDAANLTWKLALVQSGRAPAALLDAYEAERRSHVTTAIPDLDAGVIDPQRSPATGQRFVQPEVIDSSHRSARFDDRVDDEFLLVTCGFEPQAWLTGDDESAWQRIGGERVVMLECGDALNPVPAPPGSVVLRETGAQFAGMALRHGFAAVIVRPDKSVYGSAADAPSLKRLMESLRSQLAGTDVAAFAGQSRGH